MKNKMVGSGIVIVGLFVAIAVGSFVFIAKQSAPSHSIPVAEVAPVPLPITGDLAKESVALSCPSEDFSSFCGVWDAEPISLSEQTVAFLDLEMNLPFGWSIQSVSEKDIHLKTAHEMYQTVLIINFFDFQTISSNDSGYRSGWRVYNQENTLAIYDVACAPAFGCYVVELDGHRYSIDFSTVISDQLAPIGIDGPWRPDSDVTDEIIASMLKSVRKR